LAYFNNVPNNHVRDILRNSRHPKRRRCGRQIATILRTLVVPTDFPSTGTVRTGGPGGGGLSCHQSVSLMLVDGALQIAVRLSRLHDLAC
jgi:hypothetical protein